MIGHSETYSVDTNLWSCHSLDRKLLHIAKSESSPEYNKNSNAGTKHCIAKQKSTARNVQQVYDSKLMRYKLDNNQILLRVTIRSIHRVKQAWRNIETSKRVPIVACIM